jgi:hypothetical protein
MILVRIRRVRQALAEVARAEPEGNHRRSCQTTRGCLDHRAGWRRRVEGERNPERLGALEERPEEVVVEVAAALGR